MKKRTISKKFIAFIAILATFFTLSVPTFAASCPDYQSHWYNYYDASTTFSIHVKGNTNSSRTGMTIGVNSFGSNTAVSYKVYDARTNNLLSSSQNQLDYLWNTSGNDQVVLSLPSCETYRVECTIIPFPDNTSGRAMVWTY